MRRIEGSDTPGSSQSGSVRLSDSINLLTPEGEFRIKRLAYEYMKSNPGPDEAAKDHHVQGACNRLLQGKELPDVALEYLARGLKYRLITIISQATEYNDRLGIPFSDCREVDSYEYKAGVHNDKASDARFRQIFDMVIDGKLFDEPEDGEGMPYIKGIDYRSMVLCESGWNLGRINHVGKASKSVQISPS